MTLRRKAADWPCGTGRLDGRARDLGVHFGWSWGFGCGLWIEENEQQDMQGETQRDTKIIPAIYEAPVCQGSCWMLTYAIGIYFMGLATLTHWVGPLHVLI